MNPILLFILGLAVLAVSTAGTLAALIIDTSAAKRAESDRDANTDQHGYVAPSAPPLRLVSDRNAA